MTKSDRRSYAQLIRLYQSKSPTTKGHAIEKLIDNGVYSNNMKRRAYALDYAANIKTLNAIAPIASAMTAIKNPRERLTRATARLFEKTPKKVLSGDAAENAAGVTRYEVYENDGAYIVVDRYQPHKKGRGGFLDALKTYEEVVRYMAALAKPSVGDYL